MDPDQEWLKKTAKSAFQTKPEPVTLDMLQRVKQRVGAQELDQRKYQQVLIDIRLGKYEGQQMNVAQMMALISPIHLGDAQTSENKNSRPDGPSRPK